MQVWAIKDLHKKHMYSSVSRKDPDSFKNYNCKLLDITMQEYNEFEQSQLSLKKVDVRDIIKSNDHFRVIVLRGLPFDCNERDVV